MRLHVALASASLVVVLSACGKAGSNESSTDAANTAVSVPPIASSAVAEPKAAPTVATTVVAQADAAPEKTGAATTVTAAAPTKDAGAAAAAGTGSAAAAAEECGKKPLPDCPLQGWMKQNMNPPSLAGDTAALAGALEKSAAFAPAGYTNWASIAKDGAKAAKAGDLSAAKNSCRSCHDQYKKKYQAEMRARKI